MAPVSFVTSIVDNFAIILSLKSVTDVNDGIIANIFQILSLPTGYEELAGRFKSIINREVCY